MLSFTYFIRAGLLAFLLNFHPTLRAQVLEKPLTESSTFLFWHQWVQQLHQAMPQVAIPKPPTLNNPEPDPLGHWQKSIYPMQSHDNDSQSKDTDSPKESSGEHHEHP